MSFEVAHVDYLGLKGGGLDGVLKLPSLESFDIDVGNLDFVGENNGIFEKVRTLKSPGESYELPSPDSLFSSEEWFIEPMQYIKTDLNGIKSLLNDLNIDQWHAHTRNMNPLSFVINVIRQSVAHEFCSVAWCKMMEILACHQVLPRAIRDAAKELNEINLHSIHLCEAPGAFVSALNHFLKTTYDTVKWDWIATTLNPHYEGNDKSTTLNQDQIILSSLDHWNFLHDNTGNIMDVQNIAHLKQHAEKLGYVQFVTADGSIDCGDTPGEQETTTSDLHYCEIMAALSVLDKGGSFVLKIFTFFECNSISKLYLLSCYFQEVQIIKPAMSKEGNSEVYILCKNFVGQSVFVEQRNKLVGFVGNVPKGRSLFALENIPRDFLNKLIDCSLFFATRQANSILRNLKVYPFGRGFYSILQCSKNILSKRWFCMTGLLPLISHDFIFHLEKTKRKFCFNHADPQIHGGSYNDRLSRMNEQARPTWINIISHDLSTLLKSYQVDTLATDLPRVTQYQLKFGKPFDFIKGSRFCNNKFLELNHSLQRFVKYCLESIPYDNNCKQSMIHGCSHFQKSSANNSNEDNKGRGEPVLIACYNENYNTFEDLNCPDSEKAKIFFKLLANKLEKLQPGQHLVLCKYPLLSRLQFGLAVVLADYFESGKICKQSSEDFQGIIYYNFQGLQKNEQLWIDLKKLFCNTEGFLLDTVIEIVPITTLCQRKICQDAILYNQQLLMVNMREKILATRQFFHLSDDITEQVENLNLDSQMC